MVKKISLFLGFLLFAVLGVSAFGVLVRGSKPAEGALDGCPDKTEPEDMFGDAGDLRPCS